MAFITWNVKISTFTIGASLDWGESMGVLTARTGERCEWGQREHPITEKQTLLSQKTVPFSCMIVFILSSLVVIIC